jgi:hypothetical protein
MSVAGTSASELCGGSSVIAVDELDDPKIVCFVAPLEMASATRLRTRSAAVAVMRGVISGAR